MMFSVTACSSDPEGEAETEAINEQIANPAVEYSSLEEAETAAGFELEVPAAPEGYETVVYQVIDGSMIEVIWLNGSYESDNATEAYRIRKAAGTDDISGDYNDYDEVNKVTINNNQVTMKGNKGKVYVATWTDGEYTYAVDIDMDWNGLPADDVSNIIKATK